MGGGRVALVCALLMVVPLAQAETEFAFWRDADAAEYVFNVVDTVAYSDGSWGNGATYTNNGREWAFRLVDWPTSIFTMEAGNIEATVHVGGGSGEAGRTSVGWQLRYAGDVVASGATQTINYVQGTEAVSWSVAAPEGDYDLDAGDLVFRVYTTGHIGVGGRMNLGPSTLTLPVTVPDAPVAGPTLVFENLTGLPLSIEQSFANATTATHTYNWTHAGGALDITISGEVRNGTVALRLVDPSGQEALAGNLTDILAANRTVQVEAANGTWQVILEMEEFVGAVRIHADVAHVHEADGDEHDADPETHAGNETLDAAVPGKDSPAWSLPLFVVVLACLLGRRRSA